MFILHLQLTPPLSSVQMYGAYSFNSGPKKALPYYAPHPIGIARPSKATSRAKAMP